MRCHLLIGWLIICWTSPYAQRSYFGLSPETAVNYKFKTNWKLTGKIESQNFLFQNTQSIKNKWGYEHYRTDFQGFMAKSLTVRVKAAIGYQYRWDSDGDHSHRTIQQVGWLSNFRNYRIGHRVRTDQTFINDKISWRLGYRISSDIPVNGQQLDPGETYLVASNELISEYLDNEFFLENRLVGGIGWYLISKHKLELSIDYRLDPIITIPQRNRIWTKVSCYWNF